MKRAKLEKTKLKKVSLWPFALERFSEKKTKKQFLRFDGIDDYVIIPRADIEMGTSDLTIEFELRTTDNNVDVIAANWESPYWLVSTYGGKIYAYLNDGSTISVNSGTNLVNSGKWHNVAVNWDRDGNLSIELDGSVVGSVDISSKVGSDITTGYNPRVARGILSGGYLAADIANLKIKKDNIEKVFYQGQLTSDGKWKDFSGNGNHATIVGAVLVEE